MTMAEAICCTLGNCSCDSFKPGKLKRRQCEHCKHGWVAHALSKLKVHHMYQSSQVEIVHSNVVFDICSLMLYGTQAVPVRLKILLDRLFSVLKQDEVVQILNALDWTLQDYIRGYVLQDVAGKVLDRWAIMTFEEEIATLQQFLRFGETKSIVELMALQDKEGQAVLVPSTRTSSDIRTFIERSAARGHAPAATALATPKVEKLSTANVHHFENFINSMAFMLPFQLLGSVPAPLLGSPPGAPRHPATAGGAGQGPTEQPRREEAGQGQGRDHHHHQHHHHQLTLPHPNPPTESSLVGSSSASFASDLDRGVGDNPLDCLSGATTKTEAMDDFPTSDNYSDGPSTPRTPSMSSDLAQTSPDSKLRSLDRNGIVGVGGGSLKKGRVYCSACEKTFYDKGTLKIHYNAVHLKIKHKCTIDGCNMVFSSLRSRNRHSANPNPRLHMPMNRNNRDKDLRGSLSGEDEGSEGDRRSDYGAGSVPASPAGAADGGGGGRRSVPGYVVGHHHADGAKLGGGGSFAGAGHGGILFPNLKTVQPVLPFYRSLATPAELANTPGTLPSLPLLSSSVPLKPSAAATELEHPVPKKKSRKSSMPIKIDKELVEREGALLGEGSSSEDDVPSARGGLGGGGGYGHEREGRGLYLGGLRERGEAAKRAADRASEREACPGREEEEEEEEEEGEGGEEGEGPYDGKVRDRRRREVAPHAHGREECGGEEEEEEGGGGRARPYDSDGEEADGDGQMPANGAAFPPAEGERGAGGRCREGDCSDPGLAHQPDAGAEGPDHCQVCSKTLKNPYGAKTHHRSAHLNDTHTCTVDGCNAAFPSRRSRDRHSANLNLHHKLLTKDSYGANDQLCPLPPSLFRDQDGPAPDQDQRDHDPRDPAAQTSVIFRGHNRMGLVFPMSKMADAPENPEPSPSAEAGGVGVDEAAVLDLSTTSSAPPARGAWDSDGAGSEEGEGLEEDPLPMEEDSDESCDGIGPGGRRGGEGFGPGGERTPGYAGGAGHGGAGGGGQGGGGGSPITCHVCQKVYSNKGTFRAHYKTVHLRLLHKCKVPGCDTTFSSVRSRNRHSQNPNLHRNLTVGSALDPE